MALVSKEYRQNINNILIESPLGLPGCKDTKQRTPSTYMVPNEFLHATGQNTDVSFLMSVLNPKSGSETLKNMNASSMEI